MDNLLAIITIIQRAGGKRLLLRLFSRILVLLGLIITTAIMVSALLVGALINAHIALLDNGAPTAMALLVVALAALFIIAALVAVIVWQLGKLHRSPKSSSLMDTMDAFTDGLMAD